MALALAATLWPAGASAQVVLSLAGGVTVPTSDYGDYANTGWLGHADIGFPVGENGLSVGASGYYGSNNHETDGDKTNLYGGLGWVGYTFETGASVMPTVWGMAGSLTHSYKSDTTPSAEGSDTGFAFGGGAGLGFPLGGVTGRVQAWYLTASIGDPSSTTALFGVDVGVQFVVGGGM